MSGKVVSDVPYTMSKRLKVLRQLTSGLEFILKSHS